MGIAWTKPSYGINVMWQLFSCSVVERFNIDNLFQRWNLENPCVFRTFLLFVKNRKTGEASLEWVWPGMWKQRLSTHVPEKLITMWSTVSSRSSACKVPHVCLWNNAGMQQGELRFGTEGNGELQRQKRNTQLDQLLKHSSSLWDARQKPADITWVYTS